MNNNEIFKIISKWFFRSRS